MSDAETTWVLEVLARWLRSPSDSMACPGDLVPERVGDVLERNRLSPLFHILPVTYPAAPDWDGLRARLERCYQKSLLQGLQQLKSGTHLMECLQSAGIPCLAVRGPFLAHEVYGDPAMRVSADVDVLISPRDRRRAWQVCRKAGYRSLDWECPLWPVDRHRIHWRLQRADDPVVCELHWAVEPAYGVMTLDYEALLRDASPTGQFLLLCLHTGEHLGDVRNLYGEPPVTADEVIRNGMLFRWMDVAMFMRKHGAQIDWEWIGRHARDRRVCASLAVCLAGVRDWFGVALPGEAARRVDGWAALARSQQSTGWRRRVEQWWEQRRSASAGMETPMADVLYFLCPHASFFEPSRGPALKFRRFGHGIKAFGVLAAGMASFLCFAAVTRVRRPFVRRLAALTILLLAGMSLHAHEFGDDYGDSAATAQSLTLGSNVTGCIEIDMDQDWFSFQANQSTNEYVVTVSTGTLWNSTAAMAAPDGASVLAVTDSVAAVTSRVSWIHVGPPATYFVCVGGFANFTTGTYTIAVSKQPFVDQDHDGMPDSWEITWFHSTNQPPSGADGDYDHDGASNLDEFLAGTNPTNKNSHLQVTDVACTNTTVAVSWSAVPFRTYEVYACTNLSVVTWDYVGTVTNLASLSTLRIEDGAAPRPPLRFYRVRCLY